MSREIKPQRTELQQSLSKCKVEGNVLFLPPISEGLLSNYNEVRSALLAAGAKYKRNSFVFPNEAQPYIDRLIGGEKVNIKKEFQFFGTPSKLADRIVELAGCNNNHVVLEPSAGQGSLIIALHRKCGIGRTVHAFELMPENQTILKKISRVDFLGSDFLKCNLPNMFDRIIANPPFSKNQDIDHIRKMYDCLKPGGRLVSIASKSWRIGSQNKQLAFRDWLTDLNASIEEIESGSFKESGTAVGGFIIIIDKN